MLGIMASVIRTATRTEARSHTVYENGEQRRRPEKEERQRRRDELRKQLWLRGGRM